MTTMVAVWEQEHYRIRDDETAADPGTPNWITTEDQSSREVIDVDTLFRVRFVIANTGNANQGPVFSVYFSHEGGSFTEIAGSGTAVITDNASTPADQDQITAGNFQLTAGTGSTRTGQYDESNAAINTLNQGEFTELEFCMQLNGAVVADGDTIDLRVYANDAAFDTYDTNATAVIEVNDPVVIDLAAALELAVTQTAGLTAQGTLAAAHNVALTLAANFDSPGTLDLAVAVALAFTANLDGEGKLDAATSLALTVAAALNAPGTLAAAAPISLTLVGDITDGNAGAEFPYHLIKQIRRDMQTLLTM